MAEKASHNAVIMHNKKDFIDVATNKKLLFKCEKALRRECSTMHYHPHIHIWYVKHGCCLHNVNGVDYILRDGDMLIVPAFSIHYLNSLIPENSDDMEMFSFEALTTDFCKLFSYQNGEPPILFSSFNNGVIYKGENAALRAHFSGRDKELLDSLTLSAYECSSSDKSYDYKSSFLANVFLQLFELMPKEGKSRIPPHTLVTMNEHLNAVIHAICFLENNIEREFKFEEILNEVSFARSSFSKYCIELTGRPFWTHVMLSRLGKATWYLTFSKRSIQEISDKYCFSTPSYFSSVFSRNFSMSPGEFRKFSFDYYSKYVPEWIDSAFNRNQKGP